MGSKSGTKAAEVSHLGGSEEKSGPLQKSAIQKHANWKEIELAAKFAAIWLDKMESKKTQKDTNDEDADGEGKPGKKKKDEDFDPERNLEEESQTCDPQLNIESLPDNPQGSQEENDQNQEFIEEEIISTTVRGSGLESAAPDQITNSPTPEWELPEDNVCCDPVLTRGDKILDLQLDPDKLKPDLNLSNNSINSKKSSCQLFSSPSATPGSPKLGKDADQPNFLKNSGTLGLDDTPGLGQFLSAFPGMKDPILNVPPELNDIWRNYLKQSRKCPDPDETRRMRGYAWCFICGKLLVRIHWLMLFFLCVIWFQLVKKPLIFN